MLDLTGRLCYFDTESIECEVVMKSFPHNREEKVAAVVGGVYL
jgi:hypothetical protein